ncbi:nucleotidyltransferase domain-containing protein [bacterium]|nr:nucleotidyltransferase domain-containing protein [bacterium]
MTRIKLNTDEITAFCRRNHIRRFSFFGSVLREDFGPESDVDILVEFEPGAEPGLFGMARLERELRSRISLTAALDYDRLYRHVDPAANTYGATREGGQMFGRIVQASRAHFYNFSLGLKVGM